MNSAFIQSCELDDYHSAAPVHSGAIMIPTLMAAAESQKLRAGHSPQNVTGLQFLLATIVGIETAIRAGNALYGNDMLARGWHCGAVYGAPASAASAAKLLGLSSSQIEDAIGIACTQACGLMAAQFGGMIKRVQHGFSTRNGLMGAFLARGGYEGIKEVFERPYGGFLAMFSSGNGQEPPYKEYEIVSGLGTRWETLHLRNKFYAAVGTAHGMIEILEKMQREYPKLLASSNLCNIESIHAGQSHAGFHHDGWPPDQRPMDVTGSQMCAAYVVATQLIDRQVLLAQFASNQLDRDEIWALIGKTTCSHDEYFDSHERLSGAKMTIKFIDGMLLEDSLDAPRGFDPPVTNQQLLDKYRKLALTVTDAKRVNQIEEAVLGLEEMTDVSELIATLAQPVGQSLC